MKDCVFCRIVEGELEADIVFENEYAVAFMDANPVVDGHTLVVPKVHFERFADLTEEVAAGVFAVAREVNQAILTGLDADGVNIGLNDGEAAGQVVPHAHFHLIPRFSGDGGGALHSIVKKEQDKDPAEVAEELRAELR